MNKDIETAGPQKLKTCLEESFEKLHESNGLARAHPPPVAKHRFDLALHLVPPVFWNCEPPLGPEEVRVGAKKLSGPEHGGDVHPDDRAAGYELALDHLALGRDHLRERAHGTRPHAHTLVNYGLMRLG